MQRARRLAPLAALALVGTLALTGCRSQPGTAIYIGSTAYSETYVNGLAEQLQKLPGFTRGDGRTRATEWLVVRDLGKRMVAEKGWPAPEVDEQSAVTQIQGALQAGGSGGAQDIRSFQPLIKVYAEYEAYRGALQQHAAPVELTNADYADLYQRYKAAGLLPANLDEAAFRQGLPQEDQQLIQPNLGLRELYNEAIRKASVRVNPQYGLSELPLLRTKDGRAIIAAPLDAKAGQPAVVPAPAQQSQSPSNG
jgi:hypothetical protein